MRQFEKNVKKTRKVYVCVCVCVHACMHAGMCMCVCGVPNVCHVAVSVNVVG